MDSAIDPLYEYPVGHVGTRQYVSVRGHTRSIPKFKTYRGCDGLNHLLPEYGGTLDFSKSSAYIMPDKLPYESPIDGQYISSRSTHREHMRQHNVIECGDYKPGSVRRNTDTPVGQIARDIVRSIRQLGGH